MDFAMLFKRIAKLSNSGQCANFKFIPDISGNYLLKSKANRAKLFRISPPN